MLATRRVRIGLHAVQLLPALVMGGLLLGTFRKPGPVARPRALRRRRFSEPRR